MVIVMVIIIIIIAIVMVVLLLLSRLSSSLLPLSPSLLKLFNMKKAVYHYLFYIGKIHL